MQIVISALEHLQAALKGRGALAPDEPATAYLPTSARLAASLSAPAERTRVVTERRDAAMQRLAQLDGLGLAVKLGTVRAAEQAQRADAGAPQPIVGLDGGQVRSFIEWLALDNTLESSQRANHIGRDLVLGVRAVASVCGSADAAAQAVMHLRRFDDVLCRVQAAQIAASATDTPLPEVLALYRVEGDLAMPPSAPSIGDGIPSGRFDALSSIAIEISPDMSHLVLLLHPAARVAGGFDLASSSDEAIHEAALLYWCLQIAGLDELIAQPAPSSASFKTWSAANWTAAGAVPPAGSTAQQLAERRWRAMRETMRIVALAGTRSSALAIVPDDPLLLVAGVLAEGVMLRRRLGTRASLLGGGAAGDLSAGMQYLHYHAGADYIGALIVRALLASLRGHGLGHVALRQALRADLPMTDNLANIETAVTGPAPRRADRDRQTATLLTVWPAAQLWLRDGNRLDLLTRFLEDAKREDLDTWRAHRGNLSRYRQLLSYYQRVFS